RLIGSGRQREPERTTPPNFTFQPNRASMQLNDPLRQGEAEPCALGLPGAQGALLEPVEDALAVLGRHAYPRIGHGHYEVLTLHAGADNDAPAGGSELHRVGQQIPYDLPEAQAIGVKQIDLGIDLEAEVDA